MKAAATDQNSDYRVDLGIFQGPLDLLLFLIKKEEVDIYDIPIARITRQYIEYIEMMQELNLEVAGEFILMAATLIRIKVRLLLPRDEDNPEELDPREELVLALMEYKKYREAGDILHEKALIEERNYIPPSPVSDADVKIDWQAGTSLFDLLSAFREVLRSQRDETVHEVNTEGVRVEDRIMYVLSFLDERESATFAELFADVPRRIVAVVTFIALLELARTQRITLLQSVPFAELRVYRGEFFGSPLKVAETADVQQPEEQVV
ncbi:MAG: segregation/condensation protein A [candidate division Zixibacteria bacterium]|nr:segregation/condensation protein A [candidate division Zixibacteria bacterium]